MSNTFDLYSSPAIVLSLNCPPQPDFCKVSSAHSFFLNLLLSTLYVHHSTAPAILLFLRSPITLILSSAVDTFLHLTRPLTSIHHSFLHCSLPLAVFYSSVSLLLLWLSSSISFVSFSSNRSQNVLSRKSVLNMLPILCCLLSLSYII